MVKALKGRERLRNSNDLDPLAPAALKESLVRPLQASLASVQSGYEHNVVLVAQLCVQHAAEQGRKGVRLFR
jgi:hypothetical protein